MSLEAISEDELSGIPQGGRYRHDGDETNPGYRP